MKWMLVMAMMGLLAGCSEAVPEAQPAAAQPAAKKEMKSKAWTDNFATAQAESKATGRPIFAFFTGSDWCGWCIKLHKEVLDEKIFKDFAATNLILFEADFPQRKKLEPSVVKQNEDLMRKYGVQGFPTIFLLDHEGKALGQTGYRPNGAAAYVTHLKEMFKAAGLKPQAETVSAAAATAEPQDAPQK